MSSLTFKQYLLNETKDIKQFIKVAYDIYEKVADQFAKEIAAKTSKNPPKALVDLISIIQDIQVNLLPILKAQGYWRLKSGMNLKVKLLVLPDRTSYMGFTKHQHKKGEVLIPIHFGIIEHIFLDKLYDSFEEVRTNLFVNTGRSKTKMVFVHELVHVYQLADTTSEISVSPYEHAATLQSPIMKRAREYLQKELGMSADLIKYISTPKELEAHLIHQFDSLVQKYQTQQPYEYKPLKGNVANSKYETRPQAFLLLNCREYRVLLAFLSFQPTNGNPGSDKIFLSNFQKCINLHNRFFNHFLKSIDFQYETETAKMAVGD